MRLLSLAAAIALAFASTTALADTAGSEVPQLSNMTAVEFLAFHSDLSQELKTKRYNHISNSALDEIATEQNKIRSLVGTHSTMDELSERDRLEVFNAHQRVVAIVEGAEDDRVICKRVKPTGSHRPISQCQTVGELKRAREQLQRDEMFKARMRQGG